MFRVEDVTTKWELAEQILQRARPSEKILDLFEETLFSMHHYTAIPVERGVKERVWEIFRKESLPALNEKYKLALCNLDEAVLAERLAGEVKMEKSDITLLQGEVYKLVHQLESLFRRRKLACYLTTLDIPRQNLVDHFNETLESCQRLTGKTYRNEVVTRLWQSYFPSKILYLEEAYLYDYCQRVLGHFSDQEVQIMLLRREHFHSIPEEYLNTLPSLDFSLKYRNKGFALSKTAEWMPDLISSLRREGVY